MELEPRCLLSCSSAAEAGLVAGDNLFAYDNERSGASVTGSITFDDGASFTGSAAAGILAPTPADPNTVARIGFSVSGHRDTGSTVYAQNDKTEAIWEDSLAVGDYPILMTSPHVYLTFSTHTNVNVGSSYYYGTISFQTHGGVGGGDAGTSDILRG